MSFDEIMNKFYAKRQAALAMGGEKKLAAYKAQGKLNARERVNYLLDDDTFQEIGLFGYSNQPAKADRAPTDGKIAGFGKMLVR